MAEIVLFHHAQGLTDGIREFAEVLTAAGHIVHLPDLFEGRTFSDLQSGVSHAEGMGFDTLLDRGVAVAEALPTSIVYAGFSMGVMPAQKLAQTRTGAIGALFFDACLPVSAFGQWPEGLPVQIHGGMEDKWFAEDSESAHELAQTPSVDLFLYSSTAHLFADPSLDSYDAQAAALLRERTLSFLATLDCRLARWRSMSQHADLEQPLNEAEEQEFWARMAEVDAAEHQSALKQDKDQLSDDYELEETLIETEERNV